MFVVPRRNRGDADNPTCPTGDVSLLWLSCPQICPLSSSAWVLLSGKSREGESCLVPGSPPGQRQRGESLLCPRGTSPLSEKEGRKCMAKDALCPATPGEWVAPNQAQSTRMSTQPALRINDGNPACIKPFPAHKQLPGGSHPSLPPCTAPLGTAPTSGSP